MGDGGGDSGSYDGGDYPMDAGTPREDPTKNMTPEEKIKYQATSKRHTNFLCMGILAFTLATGTIAFGLPIYGENINYTKQDIESCVDTTYNVKTLVVPTLKDKTINQYCEPLLTAYVGEERNPNKIKDTDLKSDTVHKITQLRSMYVPPVRKSVLGNN